MQSDPGRRPRAGSSGSSARGWGKLNLHTASALIDQGQASVNLVAAVPSLHAGMTLAIAAFLWNRVRRGWRPVLVA